MKHSKLLFALVFVGLLALVGFWWSDRYQAESEELKSRITSIQLKAANRAMKLALQQLQLVLGEKKHLLANDSMHQDSSARVVSLGMFSESQSITLRNTNGLPVNAEFRKPAAIMIDTTDFLERRFKMDLQIDSCDELNQDTLISIRLDLKELEERPDSLRPLQRFADSLGITLRLLNMAKDTVLVSDTLGKWYWTDLDTQVRPDPNSSKVFTTRNTLVVVDNYRPYLFRQIGFELLAGVLLLGGFLLYYWLVQKDDRRQRERLAEKDRFIANVAHELKTPIATVGVALEALQNFGADADPERRRSYTEIARKELKRLELLADRSISSIQLEAAPGHITRKAIDIGGVIENAWDGLRVKHRLPETRLCYFVSQKNGMTNEVARVNEAGDLTISGDKALLEHLIYNILDNACKYAGEAVEISLTFKWESNNLLIRFCDNGPGIPGAEREKIFEKFYRIDEGKGHRVKGHGLGLAYARQIARVHGGDLKVVDTNERGACFELSLKK